jgi:phosphatidylglycerol:prolipoprotein diacylglycerol transferase
MPSLSSTVNYWANPLTIITGIRNGGLGMLGGIMGGLLGLGLFTLGWNIATEKERRQGKPFIFLQKDPQLYFPTWLDIVSPGILLAQSIGRWGNYVNQELYGAPTNLPWKLYIDPAHRIPSVAQSEYFHPTFLYESILTLAGCFLLLYLEKRLKHWLRPGDLFLIYIIYYAIVRFGMEFLRLDSHLLGSLNTNQLVVGVGAAIATIILLVRHQGQRKPIATA